MDIDDDSYPAVPTSTHSSAVPPQGVGWGCSRSAVRSARPTYRFHPYAPKGLADGRTTPAPAVTHRPPLHPLHTNSAIPASSLPSQPDLGAAYWTKSFGDWCPASSTPISVQGDPPAIGNAKHHSLPSLPPAPPSVPTPPRETYTLHFTYAYTLTRSSSHKPLPALTSMPAPVAIPFSFPAYQPLPSLPHDRYHPPPPVQSQPSGFAAGAYGVCSCASNAGDQARTGYPLDEKERGVNEARVDVGGQKARDRKADVRWRRRF